MSRFSAQNPRARALISSRLPQTKAAVIWTIYLHIIHYSLHLPDPYISRLHLFSTHYCHSAYLFAFLKAGMTTVDGTLTTCDQEPEAAFERCPVGPNYTAYVAQTSLLLEGDQMTKQNQWRPFQSRAVTRERRPMLLWRASCQKWRFSFRYRSQCVECHSATYRGNTTRHRASTVESINKELFRAPARS